MTGAPERYQLDWPGKGWAPRVAGHRVLTAGDVACFAATVGPAVLRAVAGRRPPRAVFRDSAFADPAARAAAGRVIAGLSPETDVRTL